MSYKYFMYLTLLNKGGKMSSSDKCDEMEALPNEILNLSANKLPSGNDEAGDKNTDCEDITEPKDKPIGDSNVSKDTEQQHSLSALSCDDSDRSQNPSLLLLPPEILLLIFSNIEAKDLVTSVMMTCKYFHELIDNQKFWRSRHARQWSNKYPAVEVDTYPYWKQSCVEREAYHSFFGNSSKNMNAYIMKNGHIATVDTVAFLKDPKLAASGGRDRCLCLWRVCDDGGDPADPENTHNPGLLKQRNQAHKGWVWCSQALDDKLYTGSWDTTTKLWDVGTMEPIASMECRSSVLCMSATPNVIAVGTFFKTVIRFDIRSAHNVLSEYKNNGAVICMTEDDRNIITGTDKGYLTVFCKRTLKCRIINWPTGNYPASIAYGENGELWVGDNSNTIHLLDTRGKCFKSLMKATVSDNVRSKVHCLKKERAVLVASTLGNVHVMDAGRPLLGLTTFHAKETDESIGELGSLDLQNKRLLCGSTSGPVLLWTPKSGGRY